MSNIVKDVNIKNTTYYFFDDDMINIKGFDSNNNIKQLAVGWQIT